MDRRAPTVKLKTGAAVEDACPYRLYRVALPSWVPYCDGVGSWQGSDVLLLLQGFISREYNQILVSSDPEELLKKVLEWVPPQRDDVFARTPSERKMAIGEDISQPSDEAAVDAV
jgi:hypothetical protein